MKFTHKIEISEEEYLEKRYDIAKSLLANVVSSENIDSYNEAKKQASLLFNCISLTDALLKELGYFYKTTNVTKDDTSIHKLSDLIIKEEE